MKRGIQFTGIIGLIAVIFGIVIQAVLSYDDFYLAPLHFAVGGVLVLTFLIFGGTKFIESAAASRAAGFGAGVTLYSAIFVGLLVVINYLVSTHEFLRYDSTEQKVHTLASETKKVLQQLKFPVMIRAFYLGGTPDADVEALLNRMAAESDKLTWEVVDPEKRKSLTEKLGVSDSGTLHFTYDEGNGKVREGKVVSDVDEQSIVNTLIRLIKGGQQTVYYVTGHGEADLTGDTEAGYLFLKEALEGDSLVVKPLVLAQAGVVPADARALLILAPRKDLLPPERAAIEAYLSGGGNALMLTEPRGPNDIRELVKPLGIEVGNDIVVSQEVRMFAGPSLGVQPMVTQYGIHPITSEIKEGTIYSTVCSVSKGTEVPAGATVTELALTSGNSWAERNLQKIYADNPTASLDSDDLKGPVPIAAAFEGTIRYAASRNGSAEPAAGVSAGDASLAQGVQQEGAPAGAAPSPSPSPAASAPQGGGKGASRVVVIGDADFVANVNVKRLLNRDFFMSAMRWLTGHEELVSISSKSLKESKKAITADQFNIIFLLSAVLIPELMLVGGMAIWWFRRG